MIEMNVDGIAFDAATMSPIVMLIDTEGRRALPIWISQEQAKAIKMAAEQQKSPRPMTHDLLVNLLTEWELELERIVIHTLRDSTYFATLQTRKGEEKKNIDARPSDAIVLALRLNTPIWAMEEVIADASIPADRDADEEERQAFRQFLDNLSPGDFAQGLGN